MISFLISYIFKDKSLKCLLGLQREIKQLREQNERLKKELKVKQMAMREIVKTAKENSDDYYYC